MSYETVNPSYSPTTAARAQATCLRGFGGDPHARLSPPFARSKFRCDLIYCRNGGRASDPIGSPFKSQTEREPRCRVVMTPAFSDGERDIKRYYVDNSRWFFSLGAVYLASWSVFSLTIAGEPVPHPSSLIRYAGTVLLVKLAVWRNERFHVAGVALSYVLLLAWVAITTFTI